MISPVRTELEVTDNVPFGQPVHGSSGTYLFYALTLERPMWKKWSPGQFIMLRPLNDSEEMTWALPLSICRVTSQSLVLFFRVVNPRTQRLSRLRSGDRVVVWGPLGTNFETRRDAPTLLLAEGVGIAPFAGYVDRHPDPSSMLMLFGHELPSGNYPAESFSERIEMENHRNHTSEDVERFHSIVSGRMEEYRKRSGLCLACGSMPFIRRVWKKAMELGLPTQISLEERMSCGTGACLGCVTVASRKWPDPIRVGLPIQTCTCGPVFWASDVDLDAKLPRNAG